MKRSVRYLLLAVLMLASLRPLFAQIGISVSFGPPALPVYEQPLCPGDGYIWTPGYWAWDPDYGDYYWVPGTWVLAPQVGYLWTPGWWGWGGNGFIFHQGYWGPRIGFYGGINYGFGYFGNGYEGGRWNGDHFFYNRSVTNVNVTNIRNVYNTTVVNNVTVNRVSYNGGNGGLTARATPEQETIAQEHHLAPIPSQVQHMQTARANPELRASVNQGKPPIAATDRAGSFSGHNVVAAREAGAPYHPPANRPAPGNPARANENQPRPGQPNAARPNEPQPRPATPNPAHASELQQHPAPAPPNTGNAKLDQKYQQQQQKLIEKQNQQHQQLQQRQEQEHQRAQQQSFNQQRQQQMEQRHQQQTQQMEQRHTQQMQNMQQRQGGGGHEGGRPDNRPR